MWQFYVRKINWLFGIELTTVWERVSTMADL